MGEKIIVTNRRARHDYHVLEKHEAGIELRGTEVKSLRAGHVVLKDSYADVVNGELFLIGAHINPYEQGSVWNHEPERDRKLLMHKREIRRLASQTAEKGLTLVPLRLYFKQGRAKVELGLCRGKHTVDKRRTIQEREVKREMERAVRGRREG
jgi:SsrA-binding protein